MTDVTTYERRLIQALDRIARHVDAGAAPAAAQAQAQALAQTPAQDGAHDRIARLEADLAKERSANAQLSERVHQVRQRQDTMITQLERRLARLTEQLDLQSLEMLRLKKANGKLIEANTALRESQLAGVLESTVVNRSMAAELEALQAARRAEMAEMEEILAELKPLLAAEQVAV
jgi:uncharacterized sporulation protein YeaH/YhbH (DUF444 family)